MKGLHHLSTGMKGNIYAWFSAVQSRRGRRHLFLMPAIELDPLRVRPQSRYRPDYLIEALRRRTTLAPYRAPLSFSPESDVRRMCLTTQAVTRWRYDNPPSIHTLVAPHGYCARCFTVWTAPSVQADYRENQPKVEFQAPMTDSFEGWTARIERQYYPDDH